MNSNPTTLAAGKAQLEVLYELLEIFTHDLSNPLQSLIVLSELALDDAPEGSDDAERCQQTLEAAERMRTLVQGLGGIARRSDGPRNTRAAVDRVCEALSRRWDRHSISLSIDLGAIESTACSGSLDSALLAVVLGIISGVSEAERGEFELSVRGLERDPSATLGCALEITCAAKAGGQLVAPAAPYLERAERLLEGRKDSSIRRDGAKTWLEFAPKAAR